MGALAKRNAKFLLSSFSLCSLSLALFVFTLRITEGADRTCNYTYLTGTDTATTAELKMGQTNFPTHSSIVGDAA